MFTSTAWNLVNVIDFVTLVRIDLTRLDSLFDVLKTSSSGDDREVFALSMQIQELINMVIAVANRKNLLIDKRILLNSSLIHLINEIMFEIIHSFLLLEFFKLCLSLMIYIVPWVSVLSIHLLSCHKFFLIIIFKFPTINDLFCPERRIMRLCCDSRFCNLTIILRRFSKNLLWLVQWDVVCSILLC